ncbi:TPA: hypothetical protein G8W61_005345 [Salmonella enterica]|uniref:Uncharacterized protein n=1 Tax=Salmonella enterica TaxID=28901 RepID=A0A759YNA1_SALER|nr:hypothetical protein [Salmonella enterica]
MNGLPLFAGDVFCGFPSQTLDCVEKRLLPDAPCIRHPESAYLQRANVDAMRKAGIRNGDIPVVRPDCDAGLSVGLRC